jgi:ribonuclease P protein component
MSPRAATACGLPPSVRLRTPRDFAAVQSKGRSVDLGALVVRVKETEKDAPGRLGLAISRRVGNSVVRNKVKRRVRECFRRRQLSFTGCDLVVTGRPAAAALETADVAQLFDQLLRRLGRT